MPDQTPPTVTQSALRGLACRCPRCGNGKLYAGFLNLRPNCEACGLDYAAAKNLVSEIDVSGVKIPFASPTLLWKTKQTYREKDALDRVFLRKLLEDRGEWPVR